MAGETVHMGALKAFSEEHNNTLYDAVALLEAAAQRLDEAMPARVENPAAADSAHNTVRLVYMAHEKVKAVADQLFERG